MLIFSKTLVKRYLFLAYRPLFLFIAFEPKHWERSTPGQHDRITTHACAHTHTILSAFLAKVNRNHGTPTPQVLRVIRHGLLDFTTNTNSFFRNSKFFLGWFFCWLPFHSVIQQFLHNVAILSDGQNVSKNVMKQFLLFIYLTKMRPMFYD